MLRLFPLFAVCLCCVAQEESGSIVGTVTDPNQASAPQTTVAIPNLATRQVRTVATNEQGNYTVTPLNPGLYSVTVTANGFRWMESARNTMFRSGQPFTPTISRDVANTGVSNQRPNIIGKPVIVGAPTCWYYAASNSACQKLYPSGTNVFALPEANTYGNGGANVLRSQWLRNFDVSVFKEFPITESSLLQFRTEFFNVTNTPTFGIPNTVTDTSSGGIVITSANNPRQVQFALKFNF